MAQERPGHPVEVVDRAHRVVAAPAVDVHVDEARREIRQGGLIADRAAIAIAIEIDPGNRVAVEPDPAGDDAVVEHEPPAKLDSVFGHLGTSPVSTGSSTSNETSSA